MASATNLFDTDLRRARRDRAFRTGPVLFLHERAFSDVLERLAGINRSFSSALLIGASDPRWRGRLARVVETVAVRDPGAEFARAAGGQLVVEDQLDLDPSSFDLIVALGTLDTVNDLAGALLRMRFLLKPDSLLIGAISGGNALPRLRQAMRAADAVMGAASPHVHPRIEPAGLAQLLTAAGFAMPVVDVDRVAVGYQSLRALVADLRGMGATNVLSRRAKAPLTRSALASAEEEFRSEGESRTLETFELLHFAAWSPPEHG
jgi:NADH dehydrogenase [ubiquinone] 1 alpha subcomplex assembly factor 5